MAVLGAPEELEALVGLFGKLYVYTFDCATFYCQRKQPPEVVQEKEHDLPPQVWNWNNRLHITGWWSKLHGFDNEWSSTTWSGCRNYAVRREPPWNRQVKARSFSGQNLSAKSRIQIPNLSWNTQSFILDNSCLARICEGWSFSSENTSLIAMSEMSQRFRAVSIHNINFRNVQQSQLSSVENTTQTHMKSWLKKRLFSLVLEVFSEPTGSVFCSSYSAYLST